MAEAVLPLLVDGKWRARQELRSSISFKALLNCDLLPSAVSSLTSSHLSHVGQPFKCSILQGTRCIRAVPPRHPVANHFVLPVPPLIIIRPSPCVASFLERMLSRQHSGHTLLHTSHFKHISKSLFLKAHLLKLSCKPLTYALGEREFTA